MPKNSQSQFYFLPPVFQSNFFRKFLRRGCQINSNLYPSMPVGAGIAYLTAFQVKSKKSKRSEDTDRKVSGKSENRRDENAKPMEVRTE